MILQTGKQSSSWLIKIKAERSLEGKPSELLSLAVQSNTRTAPATAGVIQKHEMRFPIELFRVNAILDENKLNLLNVQICFFLDLTPQSSQSRFSILYFSSRNTPEV